VKAKEIRRFIKTDVKKRTDSNINLEFIGSEYNKNDEHMIWAHGNTSRVYPDITSDINEVLFDFEYLVSRKNFSQI